MDVDDGDAPWYDLGFAVHDKKTKQLKNKRKKQAMSQT